VSTRYVFRNIYSHCIHSSWDKVSQHTLVAPWLPYIPPPPKNPSSAPAIVPGHSYDLAMDPFPKFRFSNSKPYHRKPKVEKEPKGAREPLKKTGSFFGNLFKKSPPKLPAPPQVLRPALRPLILPGILTERPGPQSPASVLEEKSSGSGPVYSGESVHIDRAILGEVPLSDTNASLVVPPTLGNPDLNVVKMSTLGATGPQSNTPTSRPSHSRVFGKENRPPAQQGGPPGLCARPQAPASARHPVGSAKLQRQAAKSLNAASLAASHSPSNPSTGRPGYAVHPNILLNETNQPAHPIPPVRRTPTRPSRPKEQPSLLHKSGRSRPISPPSVPHTPGRPNRPQHQQNAGRLVSAPAPHAPARQSRPQGQPPRLQARGRSRPVSPRSVPPTPGGLNNRCLQRPHSESASPPSVPHTSGKSSRPHRQTILHHPGRSGSVSPPSVPHTPGRPSGPPNRQSDNPRLRSVGPPSGSTDTIVGRNHPSFPPSVPKALGGPNPRETSQPSQAQFPWVPPPLVANDVIIGRRHPAFSPSDPIFPRGPSDPPRVTQVNQFPWIPPPLVSSDVIIGRRHPAFASSDPIFPAGSSPSDPSSPLHTRGPPRSIVPKIVSDRLRAENRLNLATPLTPQVPSRPLDAQNPVRTRARSNTVALGPSTPSCQRQGDMQPPPFTPPPVPAIPDRFLHTKDPRNLCSSPPISSPMVLCDSEKLSLHVSTPPGSSSNPVPAAQQQDIPLPTPTHTFMARFKSWMRRLFSLADPEPTTRKGLKMI
jgi:hypothetical protein